MLHTLIIFWMLIWRDHQWLSKGQARTDGGQEEGPWITEGHAAGESPLNIHTVLLDGFNSAHGSEISDPCPPERSPLLSTKEKANFQNSFLIGPRVVDSLAGPAEASPESLNPACISQFCSEEGKGREERA